MRTVRTYDDNLVWYLTEQAHRRTEAALTRHPKEMDIRKAAWQFMVSCLYCSLLSEPSSVVTDADNGIVAKVRRIIGKAGRSRVGNSGYLLGLCSLSPYIVLRIADPDGRIFLVESQCKDADETVLAAIVNCLPEIGRRVDDLCFTVPYARMLKRIENVTRNAKYD